MTIEHLRSKIGGITGIPWSIVEGPRRTPGVVRARWLMLYCLHQLCPWMGTHELAENINRECHGTAIHGLRKAKALYDSDPLFRKQVDDVLETE